jgi:hypothetical protein
LTKGQAKKELLLVQSIKENETTSRAYQDWCASFGYTLALVSIALEILFFGVFWWTENYKRLQVKEAKSILHLQEKMKEDESNEIADLETRGKGQRSPPEGQRSKAKVVDNQAPLPIGFNKSTKIFSSKEGAVLKGQGRRKDRVFVKVKGQLKPLTLGEINSLIKAQTGVKRIKHLETLKSRLV